MKRRQSEFVEQRESVANKRRQIESLTNAVKILVDEMETVEEDVEVEVRQKVCLNFFIFQHFLNSFSVENS